MRSPLLLIFLFFSFNVFAQQNLRGRIVNEQTGDPLAYAKITYGDKEDLSKIDGSFSITLTKNETQLSISYVGFETQNFKVSKDVEFVRIKLTPKIESLATVTISSEKNKANAIIEKAIARKPENDPEEKLQKFNFKNYNKFIVDNETAALEMASDSTNLEIGTIINSAASYFSEKVSRFYFSQADGLKEEVQALKTAGFEDPVYEILSLSVNPFSLYDKDFRIFETDYAAPLQNSAFRNYSFKILDTTTTSRPAYVIYFKPKRQRAVAGLEGVLYLDTKTYAIQQTKAQLLGAIKLEIDQEYKYFPDENLWFPKTQKITIRPGNGDQAISVFGGVISTGTLQKKESILNNILAPGRSDPNLFLNVTSTNFDIQLNSEESLESSAEILVKTDANSREDLFWKENRTEILSTQNKLSRQRAERLIKEKEVEEKISFQKSIATGYYPVGFWDFDLGKFFKFNNYEGIRLGFGGKTNEQLSKKFSLNGYLVYGTKDEVFKYNLGTSIHLNKTTETDLKFNYTRDIVETGSFNYLQGKNDFSIIEPRFVNINFFYEHRTLSSGLTHRFGSNFKTELRLSKSNIYQIRDYSFLLNGQEFSKYTLSEATFSFLWRPFAKFLKTPNATKLIEKGYPKFTGQITKGISGIGGSDFDYTKFGLLVEHEIKRLNQSRTEIILEGNYATGEVPLTHLFHSLPNSPRRKGILRRFSVAGRRSFETMFYNEFFSDKQAMLHIKHQLRPINIHRLIQPELVFISRHAIGDISHPERHSIPFKSLEQGYHEFGIELQKILVGFGLGAAYRYGPYSLPTFDENFAFKFTFHLDI
ncbi:CarboxypepD_reg-like domain-containing protein [Salegentibacter agarivorans]|jgi:hypothetical protein|uniref:CarboxypepD_reg-like domain-containing protein n=1 Tax=Salegentibacter agarivorans TaxID=345907 RepID=A0A1I2Q3U4_9FLAO|nr:MULTISPECIES: DUF5686 family protein [Salegentibacter]APS40693.1 carboxypeptidase [Salegentibacter sp. T436]SFG20516.1 CarboxypepD_reg-like domain-containing protein [Salegentibacter agarivorans]